VIRRRNRNELDLDNWAEFGFKDGFNATTAPEGSIVAPTWVGEHRRRLNSYIMCDAYRANSARWYLDVQSDEDRDARDDRHEYGDVNLIVESITSCLLGDEVEIGTPDDEEAPAGLIEWFQTWADKEQAIAKLIENEDDAVGNGDGVVVIGWNAETGRPSMEPYPPGTYFPVLETRGSQYPKTVHLAWEITEADSSKPRRVERITYRLIKIDPEAGERPIQYPWNKKPSEWKCVWSHGTWELGDAASVEDFTDGAAEWETTEDGEPIHNLDLGIDFIPVVHTPNTIAFKNHFGKSSIASVLQLFDELSSTDTDLAKGAAIAGWPPLATEGGALETDRFGTVATYGPGTVYGGKLTSVDTSSGVRVLMDYLNFLLKRLCTNVRIPEVLLGKIDTSIPPAGVALRLMFTQTTSMIKRMRLVRKEKHPLILKFVGRFAMLYPESGIPKVTDWPNITFLPGTFLPSDLAEVITSIVAAYTAKIISLETAIERLIEAGIPIDSVEEEIARIQARDAATAAAVGLATGDDNEARKFMGLPPVPEADRRPESAPAEDDSDGGVE
jgi:hypothetical protein